MPRSSSKANTHVAGQRFKGASNVQVTKVDRALSSEDDRKRCSVCREPWEGSVRVVFSKGKRTCVHGGAKRRLNAEERMVEGKLQPGEVAVTDSTGIVHILEP